MSEDDSWPTWLKRAIVSGLIIALVSPLVESALSDYGLPSAWLTWLSNIVTFEVPVWSILVVGSGYSLWSYLYSDDDFLYFLTEDIQEFKNRTEEKIDWKDYTVDIIEGVRWRWSWGGNENKWVTNLKPFCPECDRELDTPDAFTQFEIMSDHLRHTEPNKSSVECGNCGFSQTWNRNYVDVHDDVEKEIERRKRTGEWRDRMGSLSRLM